MEIEIKEKIDSLEIINIYDVCNDVWFLKFIWSMGYGDRN